MLNLNYLNNNSNENNIQNVSNPFRSGVCLKVFINNPNNPNSANSNVANLNLSNGLSVIAFIPGESRNLNQRSIVLVKSSNINDLPGTNFSVISNNYDCSPVFNSNTSSSNYGNSNID